MTVLIFFTTYTCSGKISIYHIYSILNIIDISGVTKTSNVFIYNIISIYNIINIYILWTNRGLCPHSSTPSYF